MKFFLYPPIGGTYPGFVPEGFFNECIQEAEEWDEGCGIGQKDVRRQCLNCYKQDIYCNWTCCDSCWKLIDDVCPECGAEQ